VDYHAFGVYNFRPPGSGKGTICTKIVKDFQLDHLSSGDILRDHIRNKTGELMKERNYAIYAYGFENKCNGSVFSEFGAQISKIVASGQLVPFELLAPLMEHETKKCKAPAGWLLDGKASMLLCVQHWASLFIFFACVID